MSNQEYQCMSRDGIWSPEEDRLILAARDKKLGNLAIAIMLQREGFGIHTVGAVRGRLRRLLGKEPKRSDYGDMDGHRLDCARARRNDESFQQALQREGYRQHCSTKAGTDAPKKVAPASIGSCTSSAGWGV